MVVAREEATSTQIAVGGLRSMAKRPLIGQCRARSCDFLLYLQKGFNFVISMGIQFDRNIIYLELAGHDIATLLSLILS